MSTILLSVVIPAHNEEQRIGRTLADIARFLEQGIVAAGIDEALTPERTEILLCDDGSTDGTVAVARRTLQQATAPALRVLTWPLNRGKGHAVRRGMLASRGRYVLFCDADGATPFGEVVRLLQALSEGFHVAIGSRDLPESRIQVPQPWYRRAMGAAMRWLVAALLLKGFRDTQCGFKLFRAEAARAIFSRQTVDGFSFDVEVLCLARQLGYRVCEVPVEWHDRPGSKVDPLRSPPAMLADLARMAWRFRRGGRGSLAAAAPPVTRPSAIGRPGGRP